MDDESTDFDAFYRATAHRLLPFVFALTADLAEAQDVVQETYVRAWQHWSRLRRYDHIDGWLRLVAHRIATDRWRRLRVMRRIVAVTPPPSPAPPPSEDTLMVMEALRHLPTSQRRAFALHYLMDLPVQTVAVEMGVAVGTVKSWLSRGRAAIGAALGVREDVREKEGHDVA